MALFTFGIIADIQYADFENGMDYTKTKTRYYRDAIKQVNEATSAWNDIDCQGKEVDFVLQLGDIIDGKNSRCTPNKSSTALSCVLDALSSYSGKYHHAIGNHELYNFTREEIIKSPLNSGDATDVAELYYTFSPSPSFRFVILDTYDVSVLGHSDENSSRYLSAKNLLWNNNHNEDKNEPWGETEESESRRFVGYSGGISEKQLKWLDGVLTESCRKGERVIVAGHCPVEPRASEIANICWHYQEVLDVLHKHDCVLAFLAGHQHDGGYVLDEHGIHHVTFDGVVETSPETLCYANAHVYEDRIDIKGFGRVSDRLITFC